VSQLTNRKKESNRPSAFSITGPKFHGGSPSKGSLSWKEVFFTAFPVPSPKTSLGEELRLAASGERTYCPRRAKKDSKISEKSLKGPVDGLDSSQEREKKVIYPEAAEERDDRRREREDQRKRKTAPFSPRT